MKYKLIGKVKEPHGLKGDLYVLVFSHETEWADNLTHIQLKSPQGEVLDCDVTSHKPYKDGLLIKVKQVPDRNHSERVKGYQVLIPEDLLISKKGETIYLNEILGFEVFLKDQCVGLVDSFSSNGPQDILVVRNEEHQFEVPFVKEFILKIDFDKKQLIMDFPEDLIDLGKE